MIVKNDRPWWWRPSGQPAKSSLNPTEAYTVYSVEGVDVRGQ